MLVHLIKMGDGRRSNCCTSFITVLCGLNSQCQMICAATCNMWLCISFLLRFNAYVPTKNTYIQFFLCHSKPGGLVLFRRINLDGQPEIFRGTDMAAYQFDVYPSRSILRLTIEWCVCSGSWMLRNTWRQGSLPKICAWSSTTVIRIMMRTVFLWKWLESYRYFTHDFGLTRYIFYVRHRLIIIKLPLCVILVTLFV